MAAPNEGTQATDDMGAAAGLLPMMMPMGDGSMWNRRERCPSRVVGRERRGRDGRRGPRAPKPIIQIVDSSAVTHQEFSARPTVVLGCAVPSRRKELLIRELTSLSPGFPASGPTEIASRLTVVSLRATLVLSGRLRGEFPGVEIRTVDLVAAAVRARR